MKICKEKVLEERTEEVIYVRFNRKNTTIFTIKTTERDKTLLAESTLPLKIGDHVEIMSTYLPEDAGTVRVRMMGIYDHNYKPVGLYDADSSNGH